MLDELVKSKVHLLKKVTLVQHDMEDDDVQVMWGRGSVIVVNKAEGDGMGITLEGLREMFVSAGIDPRGVSEAEMLLRYAQGGPEAERVLGPGVVDRPGAREKLVVWSEDLKNGRPAPEFEEMWAELRG